MPIPNMMQNMYADYPQDYYRDPRMMNNMMSQRPQNNMSFDDMRRNNQSNSRAKSNMSWVFVDTIEDINSYYVRPGEEIWFMFKNDPLIASKRSDAVGLNVFTEFYETKQIFPEGIGNQKQDVNRQVLANNEQNNTASNESLESIIKSSLESFSSRLQAIEDRLNEEPNNKGGMSDVKSVSKKATRNAANAAE